MIRRCTCVIFAAALLAAGCANRAPDLKRLYAGSGAGPGHPPVILIHGAFGARLVDRSGRNIWPGRLIDVLRRRFDAIALEIDPQHLVPQADGSRPVALFNATAGRDYYGRIQRVLSEAGGYRPARPGGDARDGRRRYYVFLYDWRRDLVAGAAQLDRFIEAIRRDHGDPSLKVDVVAHSMGGLLLRYYLRYGGRDVLGGRHLAPDLSGAAKVRKAILVGTPNFGSVTALQNVMRGVDIRLGRLPPEIVLTFPSAYELLPHPHRDWMITLDGRRLDRDLYDAATWRRYGWGPFDPSLRRRLEKRLGTAAARAYLDRLERYFAHWLERGRRFHLALSVPLPRTPVRYVVFGGDCRLTPARCLLEPVGDRYRVRLRPGDIADPRPGVPYERLMLEPGDGRVTKASLLARNDLDPTAPPDREAAFPLAYSVFLCEAHSQLTGNPSFQDNLLNLLLQGDARRRSPPAQPVHPAFRAPPPGR